MDAGARPVSRTISSQQTTYYILTFIDRTRKVSLHFKFTLTFALSRKFSITGRGLSQQDCTTPPFHQFKQFVLFTRLREVLLYTFTTMEFNTLVSLSDTPKSVDVHKNGPL